MYARTRDRKWKQKDFLLLKSFKFSAVCKALLSDRKWNKFTQIVPNSNQRLFSIYYFQNHPNAFKRILFYKIIFKTNILDNNCQLEHYNTMDLKWPSRIRISIDQCRIFTSCFAVVDWRKKVWHSSVDVSSKQSTHWGNWLHFIVAIRGKWVLSECSAIWCVFSWKRISLSIGDLRSQQTIMSSTAKSTSEELLGGE